MNVFRKRRHDEDDELMLEIPGLPPETTYLGEHIYVQGNIAGDDDVQIYGKLDGNVDLNGDLKINKDAIVNGNIHVNSISASGIIEGNIETSIKVSLESTAKVSGKITTPAAAVSEGAIFDGEMKMDTGNK